MNLPEESLDFDDEDDIDEDGIIDSQILLADERYEIIGSILCDVYEPGEKKWLLSDMLDTVLLHRYLGLPIFLITIWAMFHFTFEASRVFMSMIEASFDWISVYTQQIPIEWLASLITDGLIGGVGFIIVFLPPILFMYIAISILEDTGYLARAAFVMDKVMMKMGLHGRSFIPLLLGFGCSVPAIMAARTVDGESNRLTTILVTPLMSCAARLPVYVLIAGVFFPELAGTVIFLMYILGIFMAVVVALLLKKLVFRGESSPLLMELPMYQRPTIHGTFRHAWERGVLFLKKAGSYLLIGALILWFISNWGLSGYVNGDVNSSFVAIIGQSLQPIFAPLGFSWEIVAALVFGLLAKEIVVESLGIILAPAGVGIEVALQGLISPLSAFALMVFVLLYTPCIAAVATVKSETGSWKWTAFSVAYQLILAYLMALSIVVIGTLLLGGLVV